MKFKKTVLPNGLRIVTVPMKDNPTVTVMVSVGTGSFYEQKDNNGISHFLEHMVFKGTARRPKAINISRELDAIGAEYNAFTGNEYTGYWAKAEARHSNLLLDIVSDMYLNPTLPKEELEREKGVITEEINMYEDEPRQKVGDELGSLMYGNQPAGWTILGPKENIQRFSQKDFIEYRNKHYVAGATVVTVAGNINEKEIIAQIKKIFSAVSQSKKYGKVKTSNTQSGTQIKVVYKDIDQAHMMIGFRSFDVYSKNLPTISIMRSILSGGMSGRLWQKMREELGICYYVRAFNDSYTDHGVFGVWAGVDKNRTDIAIREILKELKRLSDELISKEELTKAKNSIIGHLYLGLESSDELADFYGLRETLNRELKTPMQVEKDLLKVTAKDIQNLAKKIFTNTNLNCAIIGPFKEDIVFKKELTLAK